MPEPLTLEHFQKFEKTIDRRFDVLEKHFDDTLRTIADTLADHTSRLDTIDDHLKRIEDHLWNQQRIEEHERRIIELAKTSGRPDLATPFTKQIGA